MAANLMGVYAIRNLHSGKVYVGASVDVQRRLSNHLKALERGNHPVALLQADWAALGGDSFAFDLLQPVGDADSLPSAETAWIEQHGGPDNALYNKHRVLQTTRTVVSRLREVRERLLVTQAELSQRSGVTEATISRLENGKQEARIPTVRKIAQALGVPASDLLPPVEPAP